MAQDLLSSAAPDSRQSTQSRFHYQQASETSKRFDRQHMRNQLKMQKLDPGLQQTLKENQLQRTQQA